MSLLSVMLGCLGCKAQTEEYKSLSVDAFEAAIADTSVVRLDVRTIEEYADGHIEGAINIDVLKEDFESKALATLPKDKTIAVNCRSGKRSKNAASILARNGYKVIELDLGFNGWVGSGKKVVK